MHQESHADDEEPWDGDDLGNPDDYPEGRPGRDFYVANDPKMAAMLLTLANVTLRRRCGRQVADDYASEVAIKCFEKINEILEKDTEGMRVTNAYLRTHVSYRILNLYKTLKRERLNEAGRVPAEADQIADPYDEEWEEAEVDRMSRCRQLKLLVLRCLDRHLKKRDKAILLQHLSDVPQAQLARRWKLSAPRIHQIIAKSKEDVRPCLEEGRARLEVA